MFETFNEKARRAIFFSRYEASLVGRRVIGSEHFLLGIIRESDPVLSEVWDILSVRPQQIRAKYPAAEVPVSSSAELPLSENAKKVLAYTAHESEVRQDGEIGPQHLLLGILRVPGCKGALDLAELGVTYEAVSEVLEPIQQRLNLQREIDEPTPLRLRSSHYALLDRLAASMEPPAGLRASRIGIALAVMDALSASGIGEHRFASTDDLRAQLSAALLRRWPRK